jgi:hypothetical protein
MKTASNAIFRPGPETMAAVWAGPIRRQQWGRHRQDAWVCGGMQAGSSLISSCAASLCRNRKLPTLAFRFPDPETDPWSAVHQGHEIEIGDPNPKDRRGHRSVYPFKASTKANTRASGQWNEYEITCIGQDYWSG